MWQLFDIGYVMPATIALGYFVGRYLESKYEGDYFVTSILVSAACGMILTVFKIKRFIDEVNQNPEIIDEADKSNDQ